MRVDKIKNINYNTIEIFIEMIINLRESFMKKRNLIILVLIVAIVSCAVLSACNKDDSEEIVLTQEQKAFYSSWMSNIKDDTPINKIAILGSHDSGTSTSTLPNNTSKTQDLTIGEQMGFGCRYFDIRVSKNNKDDDNLTLFHGPDASGEKFADVVNDILQFIQANPSEFLVLDFQKFNNDSQQAVIKKLQSSGLVDIAIANTGDQSDREFIAGLKLADVRGKAVIVWGSDEANGNTYPYLFRRNGDACTLDHAVLDSYYSSSDNRKSSAKFIKETIPKYFNHILEKGDVLTVLQAQLTHPLLGNLKTLEMGHNLAMSAYIRTIKDNQDYLTAVNIIMRDYIGSDLEKSNSVLNLNLAKGYVKADAAKSFEEFTAEK